MKLAKFHIFLPATQTRFLTTDLTPSSCSVLPSTKSFWDTEKISVHSSRSLFTPHSFILESIGVLVFCFMHRANHVQTWSWMWFCLQLALNYCATANENLLNNSSFGRHLQQKNKSLSRCPTWNASQICFPYWAYPTDEKQNVKKEKGRSILILNLESLLCKSKNLCFSSAVLEWQCFQYSATDCLFALNKTISSGRQSRRHNTFSTWKKTSIMSKRLLQKIAVRSDKS